MCNALSLTSSTVIPDFLFSVYLKIHPILLSFFLFFFTVIRVYFFSNNHLINIIYPHIS